jgi:hypothetical protein
VADEVEAQDGRRPEAGDGYDRRRHALSSAPNPIPPRVTRRPLSPRDEARFHDRRARSTSPRRAYCLLRFSSKIQDQVQDTAAAPLPIALAKRTDGVRY